MAGRLTWEEAQTLVAQYGEHSLAYSILQPGMAYFGDAGSGCVAYRLGWGWCTVLGDPVGPSDRRDELLRAFVAAYPNALFMQVQSHTVDLLRDLGYSATPVGVENDLDLATFSLRGRRKGDLRHYRNRAVAGGVVVTEEEDSAALREILKPISDAWLPLKSWWGNELEFLARPYSLDPESGTRVFVGRINGDAVAFIVMDPMVEEGVIVGYSVTVLRHVSDVPEGTVDYIVLQAMDKFREEGLRHVSLGVSPFYGIRERAAEEGVGSWPAYLLFRMLNRWGNPIYHFAGLSFHKSRYRAVMTPVYCAMRGRFGLWALYGSSRACRML